MHDRTHELLYRNLQEVFGEGDATRRRAAIEELYAEDCVLYVPPGVFVGHDALDKFAGICARRTRNSSIHRRANLRLSTTPVVWLGALVRATRHPNIRAWM
jgi:hypothetical protein